MLVFLIFIIGKLDSLEQENSSGFHPETLDPVLLLHWSHLVPRYVHIIFDSHATAEELSKKRFRKTLSTLVGTFLLLIFSSQILLLDHLKIIFVHYDFV